MRRLLALLALLLVGAAAALQAPTEIAVEPGRFISIPVRGEPDGELLITAPTGFTLVGAPTLQGGQALVNLLVATDAAAGVHEVHVRHATGAAGHATVTARVAARYGLVLRAPRDRTVVAGDTIVYLLELTNVGNAPDEYRLEVRSQLPGGLDRDLVTLAADETMVLTLRLATADRQRDSATVTVTSRGDPSIRGHAFIRTVILPFAGADALEGPSQRYQLVTGAAYGSEGLAYRLTASMAGDLSDFVGSATRLELRDDLVYGQASLKGEAWRVAYRGSSSLQRLEARTGPYQAHLGWFEEGYAVGASYVDGPWRVTLSHEQRETGRQALGVGYTVWPSPEVALRPSVDLIRVARPDGSDLGLEFGLTTTVQTDAVNAAASFALPVPFDQPWRLGASIGSRSQSPFGVRAEAYADPRRLAVTVAAHQEVTQEVTLRQRVSYGASLSFSVGARYRPVATPWTIHGTTGGFWRAGVFFPAISTAVRYAAAPWEVGAGVGYGAGWTASATVRYRLDPWTIDVGAGYRDAFTFGASVEYEHPLVTAAATYRQDGDEHLVGALLRGHIDGWEPTAGYAYDLRGQRHLGEVGVGYRFEQGHDLWGTVGFGSSFTWRVGGSIALRGGFETPDGIVDLFGGRAVGFVEGVIFHDLDRDGERHADEPGLAGLVIHAAGQEAVSDRDGRFRLALPPGTHRLSLGRLAADQGSTRPLEAAVEMGGTTSFDVPVETVVSVTGVVFDDAARTASFTSDAQRIAYARVVLQGPDETRFAYADDRGSFFFQNLVPGAYTLALDPESLPRWYEPTGAPESVTLTTGPTQRVHLGAAERPREVLRTLAVGDLSLFASVTPSSAPPGAELRLVARVQGQPDDVFARLGPVEVRLEPTSDEGTFEGYLSIPETSAPILTLEFIARRGASEARQPLVVPVRPGPLATLRVSPGFAAPDETLTARAEFLKRVETAFVVVNDVSYALEPDGPFAFTGTFQAPSEAASHQAELWADGEKYATTAFRVSE